MTTVIHSARKLDAGAPALVEVAMAKLFATEMSTEVIDRGPYANDADWDLTQAAARQLGFTETDEIRTSVERKRK